MKKNKKQRSEEIILTSLSKWQIKLILVVVAFTIVLSAVFYTRLIVRELVEREKRTVTFYADIVKKYSDPNANQIDLFFFLEKITPTIPFPMIIANEKDSALIPFTAYSMNINIDSTKSPEEQTKFMQKYVKKMGETYPPIIVEDSKGKILQKLYYTNSALIDRLELFPFVSIIVVGIFVLIGYMAFSNIRRSEESKVWVGMSKEAAHQLGTPLSSLMAWLEILKENKENPNAIEETVAEMDNDISRLNVIATRFSKIGSKPEKHTELLSNNIETVIDYFEKRLPHLGKRIEISSNLNTRIAAEINPELFAWVIENLLKNAAEAIDNKKGKVNIDLMKAPGNKKICIFITDNGKGMTMKQRRQVFHPGFTTKKRGWGLGLSLCKRIIEDYHKGKIFVKDTAPGKGTTFAIELPIPES